MEKRTVYNFSKWYNKIKLQNQEIEQQKLRIQNLEDTLNTVKTLALSVEDSNCTDGAHSRLLKTLSEILASPSQSNEIENLKVSGSRRSVIHCAEEEEDRGHCSKRFAINTNDQDDIDNDVNDDISPESPDSPLPPSPLVTTQQQFVLNLSVEEKVFSNHLLASKIFVLLEPEDLIKFRLVNKVFNENATRVLKEKKCLAHFYLIGGKRRRIKDFNNLVENSNLLSLPIPFTGYSINVSKPNIQSDDVPLECYGMNKHLEIDLANIPLTDQEEGVKFLQHSFRTTANTIEELILSSIPSNITRYHHLFSFDGSDPAKLPKLKRLILPKRPTTIPSKILKDILKSAPQLEELEGEIIPRQCKPFIVLKKVHLIKTFKLQCKDVMDFHISSKFARTKPKLTRLIFPKFPSTTNDGGALLLYRNIFKLLCECSQETLELIEAPHLTFLKFSGRQEPVLKNLKRLHLKYDVNCGRTLNQLALTRLNFSHCFPALNFVVIQLECLYRYGENLFLGPEFHGEHGPVNQCWTVKKLKIKGKQMTSTLIYQLCIIFPNIVELHLSKSRVYDEILPALWSSWTNLRTLRLDLRVNYFKKNLDSSFTGLTTQKCEELFASKNYNDAETLALPRGPNLTNLKKLRKLYLEVFRSSTLSQDDEANNEQQQSQEAHHFPFYKFFTDVTCKYAFELLPKLRVKFSVNNSDVKCSDEGNDGD